MIKSFAEKRTRALFETGKSRRWNSIARVAVRKLVQLDSVTTLDELNAPPGSRLEALKGDRAGQHSISINMKWCICFVWKDGDAHDVEITNHYE